AAATGQPLSVFDTEPEPQPQPVDVASVTSLGPEAPQGTAVDQAGSDVGETAAGTPIQGDPSRDGNGGAADETARADALRAQARELFFATDASVTN
ncbi:MAG: hypothetical protein AAFY03_05970, partial [Pseudomonadota bacterium]